MGEGLKIRRDLRAGDLDRIVAMHARVYGQENNVDARFVEMVAGAVARARERGFPSRRERIWIVEHDGAFSGSLALTDEGTGGAMVRWFLLEASLRGAGLGRRCSASCSPRPARRAISESVWRRSASWRRRPTSIASTGSRS